MENNSNIQRACDLLREVSRILSPGQPSTATNATGGSNVTLLSGSGHQHQALHPPFAINNRDSLQQSTSSTMSDVRFANGRISGSSRGLGELRSLFSPYTTTSRTVGRPSFRRSVVPPREWRHDFFCLGGPDDTVTPSPSLKLELQEQGLGSKSITTVVTDERQQIIQSIESSFPLLSGVNFELMRATGGGVGKPLRLIEMNVGIPTVRVLVSSRVGLIYIRPLTAILAQEETDQIQPGTVVYESVAVINNEVSGIPESIDPQQVDRSVPLLEPNAVRPEVRTFSQDSNDDPSAHHELQLPLSVDDLGTIEDFRAQMYRKNQGSQNIFIARKDFLQQIVGLYSKDTRFDLKKQPEVMFAGEMDLLRQDRLYIGRDVGGLTREFFSKSLSALINEKYQNRFAIFEGLLDHKLPSQDGYLVRSGIFKAVVKAMVHSFIHTGVAAFGLSMAVAEYICTKEVDSETVINIEFEDISSLEARDALTILNSWQKGDNLKTEDRDKLVGAAAEYGFNDELSFENRHMLGEIISSNCVINSRRAQLDDLKQAFRDSGSLDFLCERRYLWGEVFPKESQQNYIPSLILDNIVYEGGSEERMKEWFTEYIESLANEEGGIRDLLQAWTAWPYLSGEVLRVAYGEDEFMMHTCFNKIDIPANVDKVVLFEHLRMATNSSFTSI